MQRPSHCKHGQCPASEAHGQQGHRLPVIQFNCLPSEPRYFSSTVEEVSDEPTGKPDTGIASGHRAWVRTERKK